MNSSERHCVSNHRNLDCLFKRLCWLTTKKHQSSALLALFVGDQLVMDSAHKGPCHTTAKWRCRKKFSQWECSFHWKLRCHWLEFLRQQCQIAVVRQGPVLRREILCHNAQTKKAMASNVLMMKMSDRNQHYLIRMPEITLGDALGNKRGRCGMLYK